MDVGRLAARAKAGDVDAFTELVRRYQAMVFGYACATTGDFDLAEEASQQAFITAWRSLSKLAHPERFGGWLRGIVRFECLHLLRAQRAVHIPIDMVPGIVSAGPGPAEVTEANESLDGVLAAIHALPEAERVSAVLFYIHNHSQREVAAFLNLPVSTVNNRLRNARKHLREGELVPMAKDALKTHALPDDFAARIGAVVRSEGAIVDARFGAAKRPPVLNQVTITDDRSGLSLTAHVAQYLNDDLVRCILVDDRGNEPASPPTGAAVRDLDTSISRPMNLASLRDVISRLRPSDAPQSLIETGIKAVDLFCPMAGGSLVGLAGDMQTGKMVLVEELIHRLGAASAPVSIVVFVEAPAEVIAVQQLDYRTSGSVEVLYLPVADSSPEALAPIVDLFDVVVTLSRTLGQQEYYPAIDPPRSTSRLLDSGIVGDAQIDVVSAVRALLDGSSSPDERTERVRDYLTQPFFVAEAFTNRPGRSVPRDVTVADLRSLLDGDHADLADRALYMTGSLGEAVAHE